MMKIECRSFSSQKEGEPFSDYEDACFPSMSGDEQAFHEIRDIRDNYLCAVADGATESFASGLWSSLLVNAYGRGDLDNQLTLDALRACQKVWKQEIDSMELAWNEEAIAGNGAFATFLGLRIAAGPAHWSAVAVGDSCLFHVRDHRILECFPAMSAADFDKAPPLLCTRKEKARRTLEAYLLHQEGGWLSGDIFLLATDALACWLVNSIEAGEQAQTKALDKLINLASLDDFLALIASERACRCLKNDDTTLVSVIAHES